MPEAPALSQPGLGSQPFQTVGLIPAALQSIILPLAD